jgi:hypothetical protein
MDEALHVVNATSNNGCALNFLHGKFGKFVNIIKIAYLCRRENGTVGTTKDDIDLMMENLALSNEISFVSLSDVPVKEFFDSQASPTLKCDTNHDTVTISTMKSFSGDVHYQEINDNPDTDTECLLDQIAQERQERNLNNEDAQFIAVAWIVKPAVWVDVLTSHSNTKRFHLLTFSSRLSIRKQIVWLWVLIPNQQRFSFRWVFQEAIPTLVPKWLFDRVVFFMKDADPQQRNEILSSINFVFVNATEGTCGFHVVNMGWKKNLPSCHQILTPNQLKKWSLVKRQIQSWVYSWMNPGNVEDEDEYQVSKCLLEKFICSKAVLEVVDRHMFIIVKIQKFLRQHVYTWETL